jgi:hypothetical protein
MCILNKWKKDEIETVIIKIEIDTFNDTESVDISNGLCTYCSRNPLDFSHTPTLKAFIATGFDNGKFTFKQVKYVPSDTGFLIVSQGGTTSTANVPVGRSSDYRENAITGNLFEGSLGGSVRIVVPAGRAAYMFGVANGKVGIYRTANAFTCAANKAFLMINQ